MAEGKARGDSALSTPTLIIDDAYKMKSPSRARKQPARISTGLSVFKTTSEYTESSGLHRTLQKVYRTQTVPGFVSRAQAKLEKKGMYLTAWPSGMDRLLEPARQSGRPFISKQPMKNGRGEC